MWFHCSNRCRKLSMRNQSNSESWGSLNCTSQQTTMCLSHQICHHPCQNHRKKEKSWKKYNICTIWNKFTLRSWTVCKYLVKSKQYALVSIFWTKETKASLILSKLTQIRKIRLTIRNWSKLKTSLYLCPNRPICGFHPNRSSWWLEEKIVKRFLYHWGRPFYTLLPIMKMLKILRKCFWGENPAPSV